MGSKDRFYCWSTGFEESLKHGLSTASASRSRKEAQFRELQWRRKIAENKLRVSSASACSNGVTEDPDSSGSTRNDSTKALPVNYDSEEDFLKQMPASAWPRSVSTSENLLRLMVQEVEALTTNLLGDDACFQDQELLNQFEAARKAVVKYVAGNHGKLLTNNVLKHFHFLTNIKVNKIGMQNQQRRTKKESIELMMKSKVAALLETLHVESLPPKFRFGEKLEPTVLDETTLELLGDDWAERFKNLKEITSERLYWSLRQLQGLRQTLKNVFDTRDLPVLGSAKLQDIYQKTLLPVLNDLTSNDQLAGLAPLVEEYAQSWYKPVWEKVTAEEEIVLKARRHACKRYIEMMLEKLPSGTHRKSDGVAKARSEVRERIETAFFTVPEFQYSLLWTLDLMDADLREQFKKKRLSPLVATAVVAEEQAREAKIDRGLEAQPLAAVSASSKTALSAPKKPESDIPIEDSARSSTTSTSRHPISHSTSSLHPETLFDTPASGHSKIAMYFSTDVLRILYEVDGVEKQATYPLTLPMTPGPDNELILADESFHSNIIPFQISPYVRDSSLFRAVGFHGVFSEVILAVFIRCCINQIYYKTPVNLYDTVAVVGLPTSLMSACRFRVKTALKLAGFRHVKLVQPTTALAVSYNQASVSLLAEDSYKILSVFVDENVIEVAQVLVEGTKYTTLDLKTFAINHGLDPGYVIEAIQEHQQPHHCVFSMSHATNPYPTPFTNALKRHLPKKASLMCKPLFAALLPGLLSISGGTPSYTERFPWGLVVAHTEIRLALQNTLIPAQRSETVFRLDEVGQDVVRILRRDRISFFEDEEVSLHGAGSLYHEFPNSQLAVQVTSEGLVSLEFHTNGPGKPKRVTKYNNHMPAFGKDMERAAVQVEAIMEGRLRVSPSEKPKLGGGPNHAFKKRKKTNRNAFKKRKKTNNWNAFQNR